MFHACRQWGRVIPVEFRAMVRNGWKTKQLLRASAVSTCSFSKQTGVFLRCSVPGFNVRLPAVFLRRVTWRHCDVSYQLFHTRLVVVKRPPCCLTASPGMGRYLRPLVPVHCPLGSFPDLDPSLQLVALWSNDLGFFPVADVCGFFFSLSQWPDLAEVFFFFCFFFYCLCTPPRCLLLSFFLVFSLSPAKWPSLFLWCVFYCMIGSVSYVLSMGLYH